MDDEKVVLWDFSAASSVAARYRTALKEIANQTEGDVAGTCKMIAKEALEQTSVYYQDDENA